MKNMSKTVTLLVAGAGDRGRIYASYASAFPKRARVAGVAEPRSWHRESAAREHGLGAGAVFRDWRAMADQPRFADAVLICLQDAQHEEAALAFMERGYHVLLEKPVAPTLAACERVVTCARKKDPLFTVAHVLRYTHYTQTLKRLLDRGAVGEIVTVEHFEPVGWWHQAHSFVRGNWRREDESSFMLLAKSCHDMDWLSHIIGCRCRAVSSFGSLRHFRRDQAPKGAARRCVNCPVESKCAYSALKIYEGFYRKGIRGWPVNVVAPEPSRRSLREALERGPYGRCVYHCDNDVVDHQVVSLQFMQERTANFTMTAFTTTREGRRTRICGTEGEIIGNSATIVCDDFRTGRRKIVDTRLTDRSPLPGHGGGDGRLIHAFVKAVATQDPALIISGAEATMESHRMVFAAEQSRREGRVIELHPAPSGRRKTGGS